MPADDIDSRESDFILKGAGEQVRFQPRHPLIARPRLRERDLQPQLTFFYKRLDEEDPEREIVAYTEAEAALLEKSSHRFVLRRIGASDGRAYAKVINECGIKPGQLVSREKAAEILKAAWEAELAAATGNVKVPQDQNVHFDDTFPLDQRPTFVPPK